MHYFRQRNADRTVNDGRSIALEMLDAGWRLVKHQIHPDPCTAWAEHSLSALSPSSGENPFERNHAEGREGGT